ncbi:MAG TPA: histidinol-phosphate transaminase [Burkholderiaceae bacterium]|jgi:histidinol-phosphate aminotransferase|nr:histidinol-phosphate transaminase [Burkholderiaceae bacterium]
MNAPTDPRPVPSVIRDDVRALAAYHVADATGLVKLDAMENPYALPPELAQALGRRLSQVAINRYPPADPAPLKAKLARAFGVPAGMRVMLGNGSDELIHLIIQACARPGATVLSPWPSFVMYELSARFDGCRFVGVPLAADFSLDRAALLAAIDAHRPAVVFVSYPNNPTGNLFDRAALEAVLAAAPGLVVLDEAYSPFAGDSWMSQLGKWPNLLVLRTLSKLGLAGLRLGYLCGAAAWIAEFEKVRPPYNVNALTLAAVDFLLDHLQVFERQAEAIRAERARLLAALRATPGVTAFDSAANFILFRVADPAAAFAALRARGILIKNVAPMHALLSGCLRVTVGTPQENDAFIAALRDSLQGSR